jgi:hypothetical protein
VIILHRGDVFFKSCDFITKDCVLILHYGWTDDY